MKRLLALLSLLALSGCAAATKPLTVACASCQLLDASGLCAAPATREAPKCEWVITNYDAWADGREAPVVECRK